MDSEEEEERKNEYFECHVALTRYYMTRGLRNPEPT